MEQLVMRWKNDGKPIENIVFPQFVTVKNWKEANNPLDKWLDICSYGLTEKKEDEQYYNTCNYKYENYKPEDCWFFCYKGEEVATVTVICDDKSKEGYIHMVAAKDSARGKGIGNLMSVFAVGELKRRKMETAYLTTDDFRIPAIKSYIKGGFYADLSTEDFRDRWDKIFKIIGFKQ